MRPENENGKKFNVGLYIALILLVVAAVACGFFAYRFINEKNKLRSEWQASYNERVTPLPTSKVTETPEVTKVAAADSAEASEAVSEEVKDVSEEPTPEATPEPTEEPEPLMPTDFLQSANACLIRGSDGAVLLNKEADARVYPASMSKVMTAVVVLEHAGSLDDMVTVNVEDIDEAFVAEASMAGFEAGETVPVRDLLYGVMLPSGAEACEALTTYVAGSRSAFVDMMNAKGAELGLEGTHFTNATGLHDENHYTTCHDMAVLLGYAMKNPTFREIVSRAEYTCTPTEFHPDGLWFASTLYSNMGMTTFTNGAMLEGGKTGTTEEAGKCLVTAAAYYGEEYYLCTANAALDSNGNFEDAVSVYSQLTR